MRIDREVDKRKEDKIVGILKKEELVAGIKLRRGEDNESGGLFKRYAKEEIQVVVMARQKEEDAVEMR